MPKNLFQAKFDPEAEYIVRRSFGDYAPGDKLVKKDFTPRRVRQFYDGRMIVMEDVWNEFVGAVPAADKGRVVDSSAPVDDASRLRAELEALGVEVDGRWKEKRLLEELEKATAPKQVLPGMNAAGE